MTTVHVTSIGALHGPTPVHAHLVIDLRHHYRDPHFNPAYRELTARHAPICRAVLRTPGIRPLLRSLTHAVRAMAAGPSGDDIHVVFVCAGGRHRSAVAAEALARRVRRRGLDVTVHHRDIHRPVVHRPAPTA